MKLLQEIHAFASRRHRGMFDFIMTVQDLEVTGYFIPDFDVHVSFDYTPAGYTQHVQGEPLTRERHPESVELVSIVLSDDLNVYDTDGDEVLSTFPKGTPIENLPGWTPNIQHQIEVAALDNLPDDNR